MGFQPGGTEILTCAQRLATGIMRMTRFVRYAWIVLGFNVLVILWGAFVRATGSGAGCGSHWPLCNGAVLPRDPRIETIIEFSHRLSSGLAFIFVFILFVQAMRLYQKGSPVRLAASLSFIFMITEALIGAGLVLFKWVAQDASLGRGISIVVHLINTFILLGCLTLTGWWAAGGGKPVFTGRGILSWLILAGLLGTVFLGISGALTALGDTLFPASDLAEAIRQDFSPTAHILIRLRLLHPTLAMIVGGYLIAFAGYTRLRSGSQPASRWSRGLTILVILQLGAGIVNVLLLAPVWLQLVHLLLADAVWVFLVLMGAALLSSDREVETWRAPAPVKPLGQIE